MHQQLLGHLLGALDDAEQERVDARLERDEEWRRELAQWRRRLAPVEAVWPDIEPPRGLTARTCRFVAASLPVPADLLTPRRRMSSDLTPPSRVAGVGWCDVAVVALLLVTTGALLLPAIHRSRFHTRLAACQDSLRQFGAALTQYGRRHGDPLSRLAGNGRLTTAGVFAVGRFPDGLLTDRRQAVCPDAWLAVQGAAPVSSHNWPGTWRNGTTNDLRLPRSPADVPLLADAPSADLPGQILGSHGGQGRNELFEDGHVCFLPYSAPPDSVDMFLCRGGAPSAAAISTPILLVRGR